MLKRKKYLGIRCKCNGNRIIVDSVLVSKSKLKVEDCILEINGLPVNDLDVMHNIITNMQDKKEIDIKILRNNIKKIVYEELIPIPFEKSEDIEIRYSEIQYDNQFFRVITTSKKNVPPCKNAIIFLQGIECESIDLPFDEEHPYKKLLYGLTNDYYVTVRIDLFGNGDSQGNKCDSYCFRDIVNLYEALVRCLYRDNYKIYLFGYSIGGVIGPVIVNELPQMIQGILVFDTILPDLYTYLVKNQIRQELAMGINKETVKQNAIDYSVILEEILKKKKQPQDIILSNPMSARFFSGNNFLGHSYLYAQQIYDLDLQALWSNMNLPICILVGERDIAIDVSEHIKLYNILCIKHKVKLLLAPINHTFEEEGIFSKKTLRDIIEIFKTFFICIQ